MNYLKTNCPSCNQSIEVPVEIMSANLACPSCSCVFVPYSAPPVQAKKEKSIFHYVFIGTLCLIATLIIIGGGLLLFTGVFAGLTLRAVNKVKDEPAKTERAKPSVPTTRYAPDLTDLEKEAVKRLLFAREIVQEKDDFKKITFYEDTQSSLCPIVRLYVGAKEGNPPYLHFYVRYYGGNWVFMKQVIFVIGDNTFTLKTPSVSRDNQNGDVWEISDTSAADSRKLIDAILQANSGTVKMRYDGQRPFDRAVSDREIEKMKEIMLVYRHLGGKWETD